MTLIRMRNIVSSILHLLRNLEFVAQAKRVAALYSKLKLIYRLQGFNPNHGFTQSVGLTLSLKEGRFN